MSFFKIKNTIPTYSRSNTLIAEKGVYFASNTNLMHFNKGKFKLVSSCDGRIENFAVRGDFSILTTSDRIYFNHFNHFVGSLKRKCSAIDFGEGFFAIANGNILEVWSIPTEYKFNLFNLKQRSVGHGKNITLIKIIDENRILTAAEDFSVRLHNLQQKESKVIAGTSHAPVGLHYNRNKVYITSKNGSITSINIDSMEFQNLKFDGYISASGSYEDYLALSIDSLQIEDEKQTVEDLLPTKVPKEVKKIVSKKPMLVILKDFEEIYRSEIENRAEAIAIEGATLFLKTNSDVRSFDISTSTFTYSLDLPTITDISVYKNYVCACAEDNAVRVYQDFSCISKLIDTKSTGKLVSSHISSKVCIATFDSGHVSCFNIQDSICFRSFNISDKNFKTITKTCLNEDGCFLFAADQSSIRVIDVIKGRLVDTINLKSLILSIIYYNDFLYTLEIDKTLTKHAVFSGLTENIELEYLPTSMAIKEDKVVVSTIKEIVLFDLNLNFLNSFTATLEARNRSEMYSKPKQVDQVDIFGDLVFCAGQSNFLKAFRVSSPNRSSLIKNQLFQIIQVSRNRDLENFKAKIFRENQSSFKRSDIIEVKKMYFEGSRLYILSNEGLQVYEKDNTEFIPIEFDVIASEQYVLDNINTPTKALIAALRISNSKLIESVIERCTDIETMVKYLPKQLAILFLEYVYEYLQYDYTNIKLYEIIKHLIKYHKIYISGMAEVIAAGVTPIYNEIKENKYLLECVINKKCQE